MQRLAPAMQFYKETRSLHQGNANNMYHSLPPPSFAFLKTAGQIFIVYCGHNEKNAPQVGAEEWVEYPVLYDEKALRYM